MHQSHFCFLLRLTSLQMQHVCYYTKSKSSTDNPRFINFWVKNSSPPYNSLFTLLFHTTRTKEEGCVTAHACSGNYHSNSSHRSLYDNKCKGAYILILAFMFWDEIVVFELFWHFPTGTLLFNSQTSFLNIKTVADRLTYISHGNA